MLLEGGWTRNIEAVLSGEGYLHDPIKRTINRCVRSGLLTTDVTNSWTIGDQAMEESLIAKMRDVTKSLYKGTDVRDRLTMGIAYSMLKLSTISTVLDGSNDFIDKNKVLPDIKTKIQWETTLDIMYKNLGYFEHRHAAILKTIHSCAVGFIVKNS